MGLQAVGVCKGLVSTWIAALPHWLGRCGPNWHGASALLHCRRCIPIACVGLVELLEPSSSGLGLLVLLSPEPLQLGFGGSGGLDQGLLPPLQLFSRPLLGIFLLFELGQLRLQGRSVALLRCFCLLLPQGGQLNLL
jgi:hypothetical protein